jgi:hypothetical protein
LPCPIWHDFHLENKETQYFEKWKIYITNATNIKKRNLPFSHQYKKHDNIHLTYNSNPCKQPHIKIDSTIVVCIIDLPSCFYQKDLDKAHKISMKGE